MKKKISYTILITMCILATVGYFRYNPTVVVNGTIPNTAEAIVRVNLRALEYNIITDIISRPFSYFNSKKSSSSSEPKKLSFLDQVEIPANLFFYTDYQSIKGVWVSSNIKIRDKKTLIKFFEQNKIKPKLGKGFRYYESKNIVYVLLKEDLKLLFKLKKTENIERKLATILSVKDYLTNEDLILQKIIKSKGLLTFATKQDDFFEMQIDNEILTLNGVISEANNVFLPYATCFEVGEMGHVSGKLKRDAFSSLIKKDNKIAFKKLTTLSLDSLTNSWNGAFEMNFSGFKEEKDTIVTYEYDDDFNKVEKRSFQNKMIPDASLYLRDSGFTYKYLTSKKAIKIINSKSIFALNPLFTTFIKKDSTGLLFHTLKESLLNSRKIKNKFALSFNVASYNKFDRGVYNISNEQFRLIEKIEGVITNENKVKVKVSLLNKDQNFAFQFLN